MAIVHSPSLYLPLVKLSSVSHMRHCVVLLELVVTVLQLFLFCVNPGAHPNNH